MSCVAVGWDGVMAVCMLVRMHICMRIEFSEEMRLTNTIYYYYYYY